MRCIRNSAIMAFFVFAALLLSIGCLPGAAQTPDYPGVGGPPTAEQIKAIDIAIGIDGKELPPGSGTPKDGALIYAKKCAACHGKNLEGIAENTETPVAPALAGGKGTLSSRNPIRTVGSYWPFATSVWDYIRRAMPRDQEGTLTPNEVYSVVAYIFYKNDIIKETDVLDAKTLPKIQMPNRNGFLPVKIEDIPDLRKRGCRLGHCTQ